MELYEKILYYRKKNNLNQSDLADKLDVSRQTVYKWEQGITSPDIDKLPILASIFGITVDELLSKSEPNDSKEVLDEVSNETNTKHARRSMLDYLLMIPFGLGIGIFIFMFYCFGGMLIGFLYVAFAASAVAPFGALFMIFSAKHVGEALIYISVIIGGIGLVLPLWYFSKWYTKKYIYLAKKLFNKLRRLDIRRIL